MWLVRTLTGISFHHCMTFRENPVEMTCQRPHIMVDMEGRVRALIEKVDFNSHSVAYTIAIVLYSDHYVVLLDCCNNLGTSI